MEKVPVINDHPQCVTQPVDKAAVIPANLVKDHGLKLSANMKLRMRHLYPQEKAIAVSEEWKFVNGEAVAPVGRNTSVPYMVADTKKYTSYGDVKTQKVMPYGASDPAKEVCDTLVVTAATQTTNDDPAYSEAVPVLAVDQAQLQKVKREGRRGEVDFDPITNGNYLDRPGIEIKTSETYMYSESTVD